MKKSWTTDGSGAAPGPTLTPDLERRDGTLAPSPGTDFVLAYNGVTLQAPVIARSVGNTLYGSGGRPLKAAFSQTGVFEDGWMGSESSYNRYTARADGPGSARIDVSRAGICTTSPSPEACSSRSGHSWSATTNSPASGGVTAQRLLRVRPCDNTVQTVLLPTPRGPWRVEVKSDTFVLAELDPGQSERRRLGVQIRFGFQPS